MPRIIRIGKKSNCFGKTVFEILANLKNFGIGRYLIRNSLKTQGKTYYKIVDAWPQMEGGNLTHGRVFVEQVFDGKRIPGITEITPWHPDYSLVPKDEEESILIKNPEVWGEKDVVLLPKYFKVPPLMAEFLNRRKLDVKPNLFMKNLSLENNGYDKKSLLDFKIPAVYDDIAYMEENVFQYKYRIADEDNGEKPTVTYENHPVYLKRLWEGVQPVEAPLEPEAIKNSDFE
ncbi:hypothetical protein B4U80_07131 [Leptotrombidium deliense]|uniref:Uncharacterized protein n=1 Tax=Leptotrombidium deliense TaxID=299467 RepID=A0A443SEY7_9ACAR|nr:hypothetical protein B4U80_07131 [Leptotrombidium deliense]